MLTRGWGKSAFSDSTERGICPGGLPRLEILRLLTTGWIKINVMNIQNGNFIKQNCVTVKREMLAAIIFGSFENITIW